MLKVLLIHLPLTIFTGGLWLLVLVIKFLTGR